MRVVIVGSANKVVQPGSDREPGEALVKPSLVQLVSLMIQGECCVSDGLGPGAGLVVGGRFIGVRVVRREHLEVLRVGGMEWDWEPVRAPDALRDGEAVEGVTRGSHPRAVEAVGVALGLLCEWTVNVTVRSVRLEDKGIEGAIVGQRPASAITSSSVGSALTSCGIVFPDGVTRRHGCAIAGRRLGESGAKGGGVPPASR